jgi:hypothetical protein
MRDEFRIAVNHGRRAGLKRNEAALMARPQS